MSVTHEDGIPTTIRCLPDQLEEAYAQIPDAELLEALAHCWRGRPPRWTANGVRRRALEIHRRRRPATPPLVPVSEAPTRLALGFSGRTLRRKIEAGEIPTRRTQDGQLVVVGPPREETFHVVPHRMRRPAVGLEGNGGAR